MSLKHLKPGDQVYVVLQKRHSNRFRFAEVKKVGRKYGYLKYGYLDPMTGKWSNQFDLTTGQSVHKKDFDARCVQYGFDVWSSKEAHEAHVAKIKDNTA